MSSRKNKSRLLSVWVDGDPIPKGSMRPITVRTKGSRRARVVLIPDSAKLRPWAELVHEKAKEAMGDSPPSTAPVSMTLDFFLRQPKTVTRELPTVKPDLDKLLRACLDALTGVLYVDDAQVVDVYARKRYSTSGGVLINAVEGALT